MLNKVVFVFCVLYTISLLAVFLMKVNNLPGASIPHIDKIFHFFTYMVLAFLWYFTFITTFIIDKKRALTYAVLLSILFGIIIELLQGTLTASRSADVYDIMANIMGVLFLALVIYIKNMLTIKKQ